MKEPNPYDGVEIGMVFKPNAALAIVSSVLFRKGLSTGDRIHGRDGLRFRSFRRIVTDSDIFYGVQAGRDDSLSDAQRVFRRRLTARAQILIDPRSARLAPEDFIDAQLERRTFLFDTPDSDHQPGPFADNLDGVNDSLDRLALPRLVRPPTIDDPDLTPDPDRTFRLEVPRRLLPQVDGRLDEDEMRERAGAVGSSSGMLTIAPERIDQRSVKVPRSVASSKLARSLETHP
jgi:hypothetical protein